MIGLPSLGASNHDGIGTPEQVMQVFPRRGFEFGNIIRFVLAHRIERQDDHVVTAGPLDHLHAKTAQADNSERATC